MAIEQKIYKTTFKLRRGQSAEWTSVNPLLADGEPGFELDTGKLKIGNGSTNWNDLAYVAGPDYADTDLTNYYTKDEIDIIVGELNSAIDSVQSNLDIVQQQSASNEVKIFALDGELLGVKSTLNKIPETYATKQELEEAINSIDVDLTGYATEEWVNSQGFLTKEDLSGIETTIENLQTTVEEIQDNYVTQSTVQDIVTYEVTQKMQDVDYGEITEDTEVE